MTIIVGIDGSAASEHALDWADGEARRRSTPLHLVHGWTYAVGGHAAVAETLELLAEASANLVDRTVALARAAAPGLDVDGIAVPLPPARALVDASTGAELVVVGSRGHGTLASLALGSVADACIRHAAAPVAVIRPEAVEHGDRIVVGIDGSEPARRAMQWAAREAALRHVPLTVLHAWHPEYATDISAMAGALDESELEQEAKVVLDEATADCGATDGLLVRDVAGNALVEASGSAALLVVGSRGRGGFAGLLLGSVSRRCAHHADCPLVVVRSTTP
jgi:nucleotide-binding universal stress UspA family protein